ncbi:hypothetical protein TrST_g12493 [Triparma strigata]|uniref:Uncharacterized protein n=1 Tax=Triparma strigata TaxID=1606541 RepID=A0A9W7EKK7_9STRA|nr:hypothetical protein TrST_g12493 [Triparma strigata]
MTTESSFFSGSLFGCTSVVEGCAPIPPRVTKTIESESPTVEYNVGEDVTCLHEDMEAWYHAKVIALNLNGTVDVEYMDGDVETSKPGTDVFPGLLSMDQVRVGLEVRSGARCEVTGVTLPVTAETGNVRDYNLLGLKPLEADKCVLGLYASHSGLRKLSGFSGLSVSRMVASSEFGDALMSPSLSKLVTLFATSKIKTDAALRVLSFSETPSSMPKQIYKGQTLSVAWSKAGVEVCLDIDKGAENSKTFSVPAESVTTEVLDTVKECVDRLPEILRSL